MCVFCLFWIFGCLGFGISWNFGFLDFVFAVCFVVFFHFCLCFGILACSAFLISNVLLKLAKNGSDCRCTKKADFTGYEYEY